MGDVGLAIERAEDKAQQMQARAGAIDELLASGALESPMSSGQDDIALELERMSAGSDIEQELAAMKAQLGGAEAPKQLEAEPAATAEQVNATESTQPQERS
jgi:phage shock protein A